MWCPKKDDYICSAHFVGGKKSAEESSPSYIPSIFPSIYKRTQFNESTALNRYTLYITTYGKLIHTRIKITHKLHIDIHSLLEHYIINIMNEACRNYSIEINALRKLTPIFSDMNDLCIEET